MASSTLFPTFFLSHGGGPWPYMTGEFREYFHQLEVSLKQIPATLPSQPEAIVMFTSHWQGPDFMISSGRTPGMEYDYSGLPEHTYHIRYGAPGHPELAKEIQGMLADAGITATCDAQRGFDHGCFSLLAILYPDATIPIVQISLRADYDVAAHWQLGQALSSLRQRPILLIGSGLSYHNLRAFNEQGRQSSKAFDKWLTETIIEHHPTQRKQALFDWTSAPAARQAHPFEDHLLPLISIVGASESDLATYCYHQDDFMNCLTVSSFRFEQRDALT